MALPNAIASMNWFRELWNALTGSSSQGGQTLVPWDKFTPRAGQVLHLARKEAMRLHHDFIGTEHVLLGLISLGQGCGYNVLCTMGINLENVRTEVENTIGRGLSDKAPEKIQLTPRAMQALALAEQERSALNHTYLGTEHILLGLLREEEGVAGRVLKQLGLDLEATRQKILRELDPNYNLPPDQTDPQ